MYHLAPYLPTNEQDVESFVQAYPLATISVSADPLPVQTIIPVLLQKSEDGSWLLEGHVYRAMTHYEAMQSAKHASVLFQGPNAYISASWYPDPARASTWNYIAVQCSGIIHWMDEASTRRHLQHLTNRMESPDSPARFEHIPSNYIERLLPLIAGFHLTVTQREAVFKLSQDKAPEIQRNIVAELEKRNQHYDSLIAAYMQALQP